jgi:hypothetical protein
LLLCCCCLFVHEKKYDGSKTRGQNSSAEMRARGKQSDEMKEQEETA